MLSFADLLVHNGLDDSIVVDFGFQSETLSCGKVELDIEIQVFCV